VNAWLAALGYFLCYVPYAALTKWLTGETAATGFAVLPLSTAASVVAAATFLAATGWWRAARWRTTPWSDARLTILSGLCSSAIIATTTLAYTFTGTSVLLMVLLLRGGVLVVAPLVDAASGRRIRLGSWLALGASLAGVAAAALGGGDYRLAPAAALDIAVYLAAYFVRLRAMSHLAKTPDRATTLRYFAQEQMVSTPALLLALAAWAMLGRGAVADELAAGFAATGTTALGAAAIGVLSQGTGIFGALVLLSPRENTFSVPLNRAASLLAGVIAQAALVALGAAAAVHVHELAGAGLVLVAVGFLALRPGALRRG
jgi:hypothetical protein